MRIAPTVQLNDDDRKTLESWAKGRSTPARLVLRQPLVDLRHPSTETGTEPAGPPCVTCGGPSRWVDTFWVCLVCGDEFSDLAHLPGGQHLGSEGNVERGRTIDDIESAGLGGRDGFGGVIPFYLQLSLTLRHGKRDGIRR